MDGSNAGQRDQIEEEVINVLAMPMNGEREASCTVRVSTVTPQDGQMPVLIVPTPNTSAQRIKAQWPANEWQTR